MTICNLLVYDLWHKRRGATERKRLWEYKLQWDGTLEDYIDRRLIEVQIGWSDLLTVHIISVRDYGLCVSSHADLHKLWCYISLDVWWLYIHRMELWGSMSESGRPSGIPGTCGTYQNLNLSPSLEDWENFSVVHALPTFCLLSQELLCDWAWLEGESVCMSRPQETWKSQFVLRTVFMFLTRYSWSAAQWFQPFLSLSACPLLTYTYPTHVKLWLRKHMFMFP